MGGGRNGATGVWRASIHGTLGTALCGIRIAIMPERLIGFLFILSPDKIRSVSCMKDGVSVGSIAS